jgi:hypothetical protein
MYDQMRNYKPIYRKITNGFGIPIESVSGKTDDNGKILPGVNDDLMLALTGLCHMLNLFIQRLLPGVKGYNSYLNSRSNMII